ncbi:MAG: hypothetical protein E7265_10265 [Lachnospiraceae bacterium]|nr:hypothetical protein [Lachnospiraceae bacterium]
MKKLVNIFIVVNSIMILIAIIYIFLGKMQTKQEETTEPTNFEQINIKEVYGDKLLPLGKELQGDGYNATIDGIYTEYYVNEEEPHLSNYKVVGHIIIDGQDELDDKNYDITYDYYKDSYYHGWVHVFNEQGDECFKFCPNTTYSNILNKQPQFNIYIEAGNIHIYYMVEGITRKTSIGKRIFALYFKGENYYTYVPYMLSEGIQYYNVDNIDFIVTDYGVIAEKSDEIKTMQVYKKDGEKAFDNEEMEGIGEYLGLEYCYFYHYDPINANDVEYIEINGEKYYPEG